MTCFDLRHEPTRLDLRPRLIQLNCQLKQTHFDLQLGADSTCNLARIDSTRPLIRTNLTQPLTRAALVQPLAHANLTRPSGQAISARPSTFDFGRLSSTWSLTWTIWFDLQHSQLDSTFGPTNLSWHSSMSICFDLWPELKVDELPFCTCGVFSFWPMKNFKVEFQFLFFFSKFKILLF